MSLLGDFLGAAATSLADSVDRTAENKRLLAERLRQEKREERLTRETRAYNRKEEDRRLGREVKEQYPDLVAKEMVTVYQDGRQERRPLRAHELKAMEREEAEFAGKQRYQDAIINQMNRPSGGSGGGAGGSARPPKPLTREEAIMIAEGEAAGMQFDLPEEAEAWVTRRAAQIFSSGATRADLAGAPSGKRQAPQTTPVQLAPGVRSHNGMPSPSQQVSNLISGKPWNAP